MATSTGRFTTILARDEDGRAHVLRVLPGTPTPDDPLGRIPGPRRVVLEAGGEVERAGKGRYVAPWGETFTSDEPEAP